MTLSEIHRTFPTDDSCLEYIVQMRWPNGVLCVYCQGKNVARIVRKKASRNKRAWVFQCNDCMKLAQATDSCEPYQFSATSGSIFHDSKVPLHKWFLAISLMLDAKKGFSANQLKRALGTQYRTAWHMFHRIREAMQEGFVASGKVEVDETYLNTASNFFLVGIARQDTSMVDRELELEILCDVYLRAVRHNQVMLHGDGWARPTSKEEIAQKILALGGTVPNVGSE